MIPIKEVFGTKKALIAYVMAGDPDLETSAEYILTAQQAGADLMVIGIPFSDPAAESEAMQAAGLRALGAGTRLDGVLAMAASIRARMRIPMVFKTYLNPVFVYGYERFFAQCAEIGISGVIIPDLPYEEQGEARPAAGLHGVDIITLMAPASEKRMMEIAQNAQGFIDLVPPMDALDLPGVMARIQKMTDIPIVVGAGLAAAEGAERVSQMADGVIVGSAIARIIGRHGANAKQALYDYIRSMADAHARRGAI